jgi:hypothetical protein
MTNIEKLQKVGILGDIRQRLGAFDSNDLTYDDEINELDNHQLLKEWSAWKLGDGNWWCEMKTIFNKLEEL